jgi:nucleoside-diphosphate-sugar epimerase
MSTMANGRVVVISGAAGYIGRATVVRFRDAGWTVIALSRRDPHILGVEYSPWSLGESSPLAQIKPNVFVHLASAIMVDAPGFQTVRADIRGLFKLLAECRAVPGRQPRFILVSSQSAGRDAANQYGRVKHAQERLVSRYNGIIVRPGLVFGGSNKGVFDLLNRMLDRLPIWPALRTPRVFQPVHVDDVAEALVRCATIEKPAEIYLLGPPNAMNFAELLTAIAQHNRHPHRIFPLPTVATSILKRAGRMIAHTSFGERVNGLLNLKAMNTAASLAELNLSLRPLGLLRNWRRRQIVRVSIALLAYVGGTPPHVRVIGTGPIRRLAKLCTDSDAEITFLPAILQRWPSLIRLAEPIGNPSSRVARALLAALWVYEMSPHGIERFRLRESRGSVRTGFSLLLTLSIECILLPLRFTIAPLLEASTNRAGNSIGIRHNGEGRVSGRQPR